MNEITMPGQDRIQPRPLSPGEKGPSVQDIADSRVKNPLGYANPIHCEMDFSQVFPGGPKVTVCGSSALLGRYISWGSGRVVQEDGAARMTAATMTSVNLANGTVTRAAAVRFLASVGDGTASATFRAAVSFSSGYLPGDLAGAIDALSGAYHARQEQMQAGGGTEAQAQLDQLDRLWERGRNILAGSFADLVGGFLAHYGQPGERDRVYDSVLAISCEASVRALHQGEDGLYTLQELDFAASSVSVYRTILADAQQGGEVRQVLQMNRLELEMRAMTAQGKIREELAQLLRGAGRSAFREALDTLERLAGPRSTLSVQG